MIHVMGDRITPARTLHREEDPSDGPYQPALAATPRDGPS